MRLAKTANYSIKCDRHASYSLPVNNNHHNCHASIYLNDLEHHCHLIRGRDNQKCLIGLNVFFLLNVGMQFSKPKLNKKKLLPGMQAHY